jgi:hypothetical protein
MEIGMETLLIHKGETMMAGNLTSETVCKKPETVSTKFVRSVFGIEGEHFDVH